MAFGLAGLVLAYMQFCRHYVISGKMMLMGTWSGTLQFSMCWWPDTLSVSMYSAWFLAVFHGWIVFCRCALGAGLCGTVGRLARQRLGRPTRKSARRPPQARQSARMSQSLRPERMNVKIFKSRSWQPQSHWPVVLIKGVYTADQLASLLGHVVFVRSNGTQCLQLWKCKAVVLCMLLLTVVGTGCVWGWIYQSLSKGWCT